MTIQEIKTQFLTANPDVDSSKVDEVIAKTIERMSIAFHEDRYRLFKVIDGMRFQPKYSEHIQDLEILDQVWRDIPQGANFPNITHPAPLPEWFAEKVPFFSRWEEDVYLQKALKPLENKS